VTTPQTTEQMTTENIPEQTKDRIKKELEISSFQATEEVADSLGLSKYLVETVAAEKGLYNCIGCGLWKDQVEFDPDGFCEICQEEF